MPVFYPPTSNTHWRHTLKAFYERGFPDKLGETLPWEAVYTCACGRKPPGWNQQSPASVSQCLGYWRSPKARLQGRIQGSTPAGAPEHPRGWGSAVGPRQEEQPMSRSTNISAHLWPCLCPVYGPYSRIIFRGGG